jgi:hypothetical protein
MLDETFRPVLLPSLPEQVRATATATVTVDYRYPVLKHHCTKFIKMNGCKAWLDDPIETMEIFARRQR